MKSTPLWSEHPSLFVCSMIYLVTTCARRHNCTSFRIRAWTAYKSLNSAVVVFGDSDSVDPKIFPFGKCNKSRSPSIFGCKQVIPVIPNNAMVSYQRFPKVTRTPLGGKGWCVWAILYHLCVRARKKTTALLLVQQWLGILHVLYVVHILYDDVFL